MTQETREAFRQVLAAYNVGHLQEPILDALMQARARVGKVEAGVVVPHKITLPMQKAYFAVIDANMQRTTTDATFGRFESQKEAYRAMLSASPITAQTKPVEVELPPCEIDIGDSASYVAARAKPVEVGVLVDIIQRMIGELSYHKAQHGVDVILKDADAILERFNVTVKE